MKKSSLTLIILLVLDIFLVIFTAGCTGVNSEKSSDPIIGHWNGMAFTDLPVELDTYSNGTAFFSLDSFINEQVHPLTWEKNPNGTYTLNGNDESRLITMRDGALVIGNPDNGVILYRNLHKPVENRTI
jgi:hypothetical protein